MKLRVVLAVVAGFLVFAPPVSASTAPAGFLPSSIDWLSVDHGAVLGYAPCNAELCPHLLVTVDGGSSWREVNAPPTQLPDNHNQVKLTVADPRNAFVSDGNSL
ncbi:MAG: hypothetical protein ABW215_17710 [Kibdelosporangium sp.]